ncbi:aquaporin-7-like [Centruroides sculpturatus]|uniref:aquaporin-7-like n=1 Tax=Centruroides sculpturatus TaxID=218467 RepID=UPI000C6D5DC7|nr:aquaporin-7-like [Centruroides sculpturatus]
MLSQYLGAFLSAAILFLVYRDGIEAFDKGIRSVPPNSNATANIFSCFPQEYASTFTCVMDQIVSTGLLLAAVCSTIDERNMSVPKGMAPLMIGLTLCGIMMGFGSNCGAPLNPARDLGPRIFTAMAGWGTEVFSVRDYNWFWIPVIGPHIGAILGVWIYSFAVEVHWPNTSYDLTKDPPSEVQVQSQVQMQSVKVYDSKQ